MLNSVTAWTARIILATLIAFGGVWGEVALRGVMNPVPPPFYRVKIHYIEHTGKKDCRIVPVAKSTGDPKFIYTDFWGCETLQKGDYVTLPDPSEYSPDN